MTANPTVHEYIANLRRCWTTAHVYGNHDKADRIYLSLVYVATQGLRSVRPIAENALKECNDTIQREAEGMI